MHLILSQKAVAVLHVSVDWFLSIYVWIGVFLSALCDSPTVHSSVTFLLRIVGGFYSGA
jgi:hypothetical protein